MNTHKKINNKLLALLSSLVLLANACSNISGNGLSTTNTSTNVSTSNITDEEEIKCAKETGFNVKSENTQSENSNKEPLHEVDGSKIRTNPGFDFFHSSKNPKSYYSVSIPVPEDARDGGIYISFKDEYMVRMDKKFKDKDKSDSHYGLTSEPARDDIRKVEKILFDYGVKELINTFPKGEDEANFLETEMGKDCKCDYPNPLSGYSAFIKNQNIKEMVDKLRASPIVRKVNFYSANDNLSTSSEPRNEPIFNNNLSFQGVPPITEQSRYYFHKTNMYKAFPRVETDVDPNNTPSITVIDRGFMLPNTHEDLPIYGKDNYNNSYIFCDDGIGCQTSTTDSSLITTEDDIHGTMVSSVASAPVNSKGTVGYSYKSKIIPIKTLQDQLGIGVQRAIYYSVDNTNSKVINISIHKSISGTPYFHTPIEFYEGVTQAISYAYLKGIIVVISSGNNNNKINDDEDINVYISKALVVGAVAKNTNNRIKDYGYGKRVDIAAPGEKILVPSLSGINKYQYIDGTSFSTPQVAGAAALLMGLYNRPDLRTPDKYAVDKVKNLLINTAAIIQTDKPLGSRTNQLNIPNGRMLDVYAALDTAVKMQPNKNYVRLFNSDYSSEAYFNTSNSFLGVQLKTLYKEDKILEIPTNITKIGFSTKNIDCVYSWGYQIWKNGEVTYENVRGIAGKRKPLKAHGLMNLNEQTENINYNSIDPLTGSPLLGVLYGRLIGITASPNDSNIYQGPDVLYNL